MLDLCHLFGPGFLCTGKTCVVVVALPKPTKDFLGKGLLLPGFHPLPFLCYE